MLVYKATDKNMQCRGFQYEIGVTHETDKAKLCEYGFHGCLSAVDVLKYYSPANSRFFVAELDGVTDETGDDSKRVGTKITLLREISVSELAEIAVKSVFNYLEFYKKIKSSSNAGNYGTANAGNCGAANAGEWGAANAGFRGASNAGDYGTANAGNYGTANAGRGGVANGGDWGAANVGYSGAANAGDWGVANAGDWGAANAGDYGAANAGDWGTANAGDWGAAISHLDGSSVVGTSGTASGYGEFSRVKGDTNSVLIIFQLEENEYIPHVAIVDGKKILPNVFYTLKNGKFVEWEESE